MEGGVQESVQAQRAPAFEQLAPAKEIVERRAGQGQDEQRDRVPPRALLECLDRVGGQVIGKEVDEQEHESRPSIDVDGDLKRGVALKKRFHLYQSKTLKVLQVKLVICDHGW